MGSVLIEKIPIINKGLFKKVCRIMVNNSTYFINKFFLLYAISKRTFCKRTVYGCTDFTFGHEACFLSAQYIYKDAIRICKLHIDTDRFVAWQSIHS